MAVETNATNGINISACTSDSLEIMKSSPYNTEEIDSKSPLPPPKNSNTRELIKKAREAANQKFAQTINKAGVEVSSSERKIVLRGEESSSWHGALIKTRLKRPNNPIKPKNIKPAIPSPSTGSRGSKCLFEFYKEIRGEYEDFREIEASRLQRRLEKLSDFPLESDLSKFEGKNGSTIYYTVHYILFDV